MPLYGPCLKEFIETNRPNTQVYISGKLCQIKWFEEIEPDRVAFYPDCDGYNSLVFSDLKKNGVIKKKITVLLPEPTVTLPIPNWIEFRGEKNYMVSTTVFKSEVKDMVKDFYCELGELIEKCNP